MKKGRASRASRTSKASSRLSTQSNVTTQSELETTSIPDLDESIDSSNVSMMSSMSTTSTATNKGKRKAAGGRAKGTAKSKRTKTTKVKKEKEPATEPTPEIAHEAEEKQHTEQAIELEQPAHGTAQEQYEEPEPRPIIPSPPRAEDEQVPEESEETIPATTSSPLQHKVPSARASSVQPITQPSPAILRATTPTHSPSISDTENAPPSTLPKSSRPIATIPSRSPGSQQPAWKPIDIELAFQSIPLPEFLNTDADLTEEEQKMTVQEWVEHMAAKAEAELKAEGERVVGVFEREGAKAMGVLEELVCA